MKKMMIYLASSITSLDDDEEEVSSESYQCDFDSLGDMYRIRFSHSTDNAECHESYVILPGRLTIKRQGAICSEMIFTEGYAYRGIYSVGGMEMDMTVQTERLQIDMSSEGGRIRIKYMLTIGGVSRLCLMNIRISAGQA